VEFFEENGMVLEPDNWTEEAQKALTIPPSLKGDAKEMGRTRAFDLFCGKASKWIHYLSNIPKLKKQFLYLRKWHSSESDYEHEHEDEDEDEDEDEEVKQRRKEKVKKKKQSVLQEAERMFKIMGDIAVDIGIPCYIAATQNFYYTEQDIEKGTKYTRVDGSMFYVNGKDLSDAQKELSPFAYILAH